MLRLVSFPGSRSTNVGIRCSLYRSTGYLSLTQRRICLFTATFRAITSSSMSTTMSKGPAIPAWQNKLTHLASSISAGQNLLRFSYPRFLTHKPERGQGFDWTRCNTEQMECD